PDSPPPDRCGSCTRCIDACPTNAIVPDGHGGWTLDSRMCISYLTIEKRGTWAEGIGALTGNHVFGCDICQDVCPWNRRAPVTDDSRFEPQHGELDLASVSELSEEDFQSMFRNSPVRRAKYEGFLRNVRAATRNAADKSLESVSQQSPDVSLARAGESF
ncbi:MAG: 4Fe-4S dicluster domain-containing protein, partial [Acidobacteriaceae bacterium]|nr:4Fe-4S dicluster domain-containing protein [Acidobacteriaceae bacterium]